MAIGVREAGDGASGLDAVRARAARPGRSSTSSCPACRAPRSRGASSPRVPGQPILFVSGYSETEAIRRAAPDAPMLAKPFRADALDAAVRDALASRRRARDCRALAGQLARAEAEHHLVGALVAQRPAEQIALDGVAAEVAHPLEILGGLDALGGDDMRKLLASWTIDWMIATFSGRVPASRTKLPSIFSLWNTALFR